MDNIKYLECDVEVMVLEETKLGYIVDYVMHDEETGEDFIDNRPFFVDKVFDSAPTYKYDAKVVLLQRQIEELEALEKELASQITSIQDRGKYKQYEQLRLLDDFLDGKITHYVEIRYQSPKILEFKESHCSVNRDELRLLSLFGCSNGNLEWRLNQYKDGSGSYVTVIPCTSYDMALEEAQECIDLQADKEPSEYVIQSAQKYGLRLPQGYIERWAAERVKINENAIVALSNKIEYHKKEIDELKGTECA